LRGQGRSPLKYINCGVFISLEKKNYFLKGEFGFPLISWTRFLPQAKLLAPEDTKTDAM
jgi:hypothetical protein